MNVVYRSLTVENFGPYKGKNVLTFSLPRDGSPVTLVDGKNGYGKTTLLEAFHWLLYGEQDPRARFDRINRQATAAGSATMSIELQFERGGSHHQIIRSVDTPRGIVYTSLSESLTYLVDGVPQANPTSKIREVLPRPASQFFFFDGAKIMRYADLENDQSVREAIELVLGLPAYENAIIHLRKLRAKWEEAARKEEAKDEEQRKKLEELNSTEKRKQSLESRLAESRKQHVQLGDKKEALTSELAKFEHLQERLVAIRQLETQEAHQKDRLDALRKEQAQAVRRNAQWYVLPLLQESLALREAELEKLQVVHEAHQRRRFVMEFIERLDGLDPRDAPPTLPATLAALVDKIYPKPSTGIDTTAMAQLHVNVGRLREKVRALEGLPTPQETQAQYKKARAKLAQLQTELRNLRQNLRQVDEHEAQAIAEKQEAVVKQMGTVEGEIAQVERELQETMEKYQELRKLASKSAASDQAKQLYAMAEKAEKLENAFRTVLDLVRNEKRKSIETEATALFRKLTRKPDVYERFRINDDYTLSLLDRDGIEHRRDQISAGEKQLVALSFIVGLMRSTEKQAPLVIDTPFGHLDKLHRENVIRHLPEVGQQLVFLVTDADVAKEHEALLNAKTGKKFVIDYDGKTQTSRLREVTP